MIKNRVRAKCKMCGGDKEKKNSQHDELRHTWGTDNEAQPGVKEQEDNIKRWTRG